MSKSDRVKLFRFRNLVKQCLADLAWLAQNLPEPQQSQIFTPENLNDLVLALLGREPKKRVLRHYQLARKFAEFSLAVIRDKIDPLLWDHFDHMHGIIESIRKLENRK